MPTLTLDIALFIGFFVLNVIVGFKYRGKRQTFQEYAIGDKKFSTAILTATMVATFVSGSALFIGLENTYSQELYYIMAIIIGAPVGLLITSCVIGPRMGKFLNNVSFIVFYGLKLMSNADHFILRGMQRTGACIPG